jgi:hypothetical protein
VDDVTVEMDSWEFPVESPPLKRGRRTRRSSVSPEVTARITRRNSIAGVEGIGRDESDEAPVVPRKRKITKHRVESDTEEIMSQKDKELDEEIVGKKRKATRKDDDVKKVEEEEGDVIAVEQSPSSKKASVAIEVPSKPARKTKKKRPLTEIDPENIITTEARQARPFKLNSRSAKETSVRPSKEETSKNDTSENDTSENDTSKDDNSKDDVFKNDLEDSTSQDILADIELSNEPDTKDVALVTVQPTPPAPTAQESKAVAKGMSPPRGYKNVAHILAKSPNRPMYRVGLSRRMNIEPLHGYLKKKAS